MKKTYKQATVNIIYCREQEDIITTSSAAGDIQERVNTDVFHDEWWRKGE